MELTGTYELQGSARDIWQILHSPKHLKTLVPGCTAMETDDGGRLKATVTTRIGPMKVNFDGSMSFHDIASPTHFHIVGQGEGGPAGFVKGTADICLAESAAGTTTLTYTVHSDIGGKLASLGGRLLEAISRRNIDSFFQDLQNELSGASPNETVVTATRPAQAAAAEPWNILPALNTALLAAATVALWVIALK